MRKKKSEDREIIQRQSPVGGLYHPLQYLGSIAATDCRKQITGIANMPYPADPLVEPEFVGLTYYQVAVIRQMELAARHGGLDALEFISDRILGKPAQLNLNVNTQETYREFLEKIAEAEDAEVVQPPADIWQLE